MTSTTVATLLNEARYDLNDHGKQKFDDTYLLYMFNRGVRILDRELIRIKSNLTLAYSVQTLSANNNEIEVASGENVNDILRVYYSISATGVVEGEVQKKSLDWIYRYRFETIGESTGHPNNFAIWKSPLTSTTTGRKIYFDYTADQDYYITFIFNYLTGTLSLTSYLPYDGMFNDYLREGIVSLARRSQDNTIIPTDQMWREIFRRYVHEYNLSISNIPKYVNLDF